MFRKRIVRVLIVLLLPILLLAWLLSPSVGLIADAAQPSALTSHVESGPPLDKGGLLRYVAMAPNETTITYTQSLTNMINPERGFYNFLIMYSSSQYVWWAPALADYRTDDNVSLVYCAFVLDDFVSSPIDTAFLTNIDDNLGSIRDAGLKCILRFAYVYSRNENPPYGDADKATVLGHIAQLAPVIQANSDVILTVQAGFIGVYGEWYYTDHFVDDPNDPGTVSPQQYADRFEVTNALLDAVPPDRFIQVRTPQQKQSMLGSTVPVTAQAAFTNTPSARIGFHNDCFLASNSDFGTYLDADDRPFTAAESHFVPMGGETCKDNPPRSECPTALAELAEYHFTYLNRLYHPDVLAGWVADGCMDEVERKLGYRLSLLEGSYQDAVRPKTPLSLQITLTNTGYAAPINPRPVEIILASATERFTATLDVDVRTWSPDSGLITLDEAIYVPACMPDGDYDLYMRLPDAADSLKDRVEYAVRLANDGTWIASGENALLHTVQVSGAAPDNSADVTTFFSSATCSPTYDIDIDARDLSAPQWAINAGGYGAGTNTAVSTLNLAPGEYVFQAPGSSVTAIIRFTVSPTGTITYDPNHNAYANIVDGRTLDINGLPINVDATALSPDRFNLNSGAAGTSTSRAGTFNLLPGTYAFNSPLSRNAALFSVSVTGTITIDPDYQPFMSGSGTDTLTVTGHEVMFEADEELGPDAFNLYSGAAGGGSTRIVETLRLIPGDYTYNTPPSRNGILFSVSPTGTVDFDSSHDGYISGRFSNHLSVSGLPINFNGSDLSSPAFNLNTGAAGGGSTAVTETLRLLPGSYSYHAPASRSSLFFTVTVGGTVDYDASLNSYVDGRGTDALIVSGLPVNFDATTLSSGAFNLTTGAAGGGSTAMIETLNLLPGSYSFHAPASRNSFPFTVSVTGTVDYDSGLDNFVSGRFTNTLSVSGHAIKVDATRLPANTFNLTTGAAGGGSTAITETMHLLPGSYTFHAPASRNAFPFAVSVTGTVEYDESAVGAYVDGAGSDTLSVLGLPVQFNGSALSATTFNFLFGSVSGGETAVTETLNLLPGTYTYHAPAYRNSILMSVSPTGTVDYDAELDGALEGRHTPLLKVDGFEITIDASALTGTSILLGPHINATAEITNPVSFRLLPGSYTVQDQPPSGSPIQFSLSPTGTINYDAAKEGMLSGSGSTTLTVTSLPIVDGDEDGVPDHIDNCYWVENSDQLDTDMDGLGDECDVDKDGDLIVDDADGYMNEMMLFVSLSRTVSISFTDQHEAGGTVYGHVVDTGGNRVIVRSIDTPSQTVRITAIGFPTQTTTVNVCGETEFLTPDAETGRARADHWCGSLTSQVSRGFVDILLGNNVLLNLTADMMAKVTEVESGTYLVENLTALTTMPVEISLGENATVSMPNDTSVLVGPGGGEDSYSVSNTADSPEPIEMRLGDDVVVTVPSEAGAIVTESAEGEFAVANPPDSEGSITIEDETGEQVELEPGESTNQAPTVDAGGDQFAFEHTVFTLNQVTFDDADPGDVHVAIVDWGDGSAENAPVDQASQQISASHVYSALGTYTVTVTISDAAGAFATDALNVTVVHGFLNYCLFANDGKLQLDKQVHTACSAAALDKVDIDKQVQVDGTVISWQDKVTLDKEATLLGHVLAGKKVDIDKASTVSGNITAGNDIVIRKDATVGGNAVSGEAVHLHDGGSVGGVIVENSTVSLPPYPSALQLALAAAGADIDVPKNEVLALPAGTYGKVTVKRDATLQLSSGSYLFEQLKVENGGTLEVDAGGSDGTVIQIEKTIKLDKDASVTVAQADAARLLFVVAGNRVAIEQAVAFEGTVIAPHAHIKVGKAATVAGALYGAHISVEKEASITYAPALRLFSQLFIP